MPDEKPVPVTLESIAQQIAELQTSIVGRFGKVDSRFAQVDSRFAQVDSCFAQIDSRFAQIDGRFAQIDGRFAQIDGRFAQIEGRITETSASIKSELRVEIEAVREDVRRVYDTVIAQREMNERFLSAQERLSKRVDNHDLRITALEHPDPRS